MKGLADRSQSGGCHLSICIQHSAQGQEILRRRLSDCNIGDPDHPEVIGINGWCNNTALVTKDGSELNNLHEKVCVLSQTTEKISNFEKTLDRVSRLAGDVVSFNTICSATSERQSSADEVSRIVDLMIVIGGKHSSNTKKLYEICSENCSNTLLIENAKELTDDVIIDSRLKGSE